MKPLPSLLLLPFAIAIAMVLPAARAANYTLPGTNITLTYQISGDPAVATITDCNDDAIGDLVIPSTLGGVPVTGIGSFGFFNCYSLTSVTIPEGVSSIDDYAFALCFSLTSVTIPEGVTAIGESAFFLCSSPTSIVIPNSVTSIGDFAFSVCDSLTSIVVDGANLNYSSLGGVLFDKSLTTLIQAPGALSGSFSLPIGVTSILNFAFYGCSSLTSVTIPTA